MSFSDPVGGHVEALGEGAVLHYCPFTFMFGMLPIGATAMAVELPGTDRGIAIVSPTPYGRESVAMLEKLQPDVAGAGTGADGGAGFNVRYLISTNLRHHLALKSWLDKYPQAQVIGTWGLGDKKKADGVKVAYEFTPQKPTADAVGLPPEVSAVLDFAYIPVRRIHEIVVYHKPSRTMFVTDMLLNLPSRKQYQDSGIEAAGVLTNLFTADSYLTRAWAAIRGSYIQPPAAARIINWGAERMILAHGDPIEGAGAVQQRVNALYGSVAAKAR